MEFALLLPMFLATLLAMIDWGLGVYAYNTVSYAAQDGMRRGIVLGKDCGAYTQPGNKQNFSGGGDPSYSDGVAANDASQQTFTTSTVTTPVSCTGNSTPRLTIVGAVNGAAGLLDRTRLKVIIEQAPGATSGSYLPLAGETVKVRVMYEHRPIWGFLIDGIASLSQFNFDLTMNTHASGRIQ